METSRTCGNLQGLCWDLVSIHNNLVNATDRTMMRPYTYGNLRLLPTVQYSMSLSFRSIKSILPRVLRSSGACDKNSPTNNGNLHAQIWFIPVHITHAIRDKFGARTYIGFVLYGYYWLDEAICFFRPPQLLHAVWALEIPWTALVGKRTRDNCKDTHTLSHTCSVQFPQGTPLSQGDIVSRYVIR